MALFKVEKILSGNKIKVANGWSWGSHEGTKVQIAGYNPSTGAQDFIKLNEDLAKDRLNHLINNKDVELGEVVRVDGDCITCMVYYNGIDISKYFPEYKTYAV